MKLNGRTVLACTCRNTLQAGPGPIEAGALTRACGAAAAGPLATELCRAGIGRFQAALAEGGPVLVACTQEAPTFRQAAAEAGSATPLSFVDIRETAGWSSEAAHALPKIAALIVAATLPEATPAERGDVTLVSQGVTVLYGGDERVIAAAEQLKDRLDLTVILTGTAEITPPRRADYPVVRGTITRATGHLGAFDLVVDGFATPLPSSRAALEFGPARDGARSRCDLVLDLSGGLPLLPGHEHREGYLRAAPDDPVAVQRMLFAAAELVGSFSKPRAVALRPETCAHSRSGQVGCTRCLDVCPAGALFPAGDSVALDPHLCAGCGSCAAVCPTAAIQYVSPPAEAVARRLRALLVAYRQAGGAAPPLLLLHDADHGTPVIEMLARHGDGLPARVIPMEIEGQTGLDAHATALAFGAAGLLLLCGERNRDRQDAMAREVALMEAITVPLGLGAGRTQMLVADDPFVLGAALAALPPGPEPLRPAAYLPTGDKLALTRQALDALHLAAPQPVPAVPLPQGAPIGRIHVDTAGCTLCLACVAVCPTSALRDHAERPMVKFIEDLCVQCGLCRSTCPESVVTLEPRAAFGAARRAELVLNEEEPAICIRCAKPFGTKASIEKVAAQLTGKHWMFKDPAIADRIRMCGDCRVVAQTRRGLDPYAGPERPPTRTTDDYR